MLCIFLTNDALSPKAPQLRLQIARGDCIVIFQQLTRRGLANMVYPAGYTKINNVANTWAPEIASILAARGYKFVYNASMNGSNEYYDKDGHQVDRDTFWANFK